MPYQQKRGARQLRQSSRTKPASPPFFVPREHFVSPLRHHHATPRPGAASTLCGFQRGDRGRRRFIPVPKFRPQAPVRRSSLTKRTTRISGWSWQASGASRQSKAKELGAPPESVAQIIDAVTLGIIRTSAVSNGSTCFAISSCQREPTLISSCHRLWFRTAGKFRHLPVVEEGRLIGIVLIGDVVKASRAANRVRIRDLA
jgi:CBS domain-containing protein